MWMMPQVFILKCNLFYVFSLRWKCACCLALH